MFISPLQGWNQQHHSHYQDQGQQKQTRKQKQQQQQKRQKYTEYQRRVRYADAAYQLCGRQADYHRVLAGADHRREYDRMVREYIANGDRDRDRDDKIGGGRGEKVKGMKKVVAVEILGRYRPGSPLPKISCVRRKVYDRDLGGVWEQPQQQQPSKTRRGSTGTNHSRGYYRVFSKRQ